MNVLIIGAGGMIGRKLATKLASTPVLNGQEVHHLHLVDVFDPSAPAGTPCRVLTEAADVSAPGEAARLLANRPDIIFHLAAIVSGEAETDFEKGYRINLDGTLNLLEAIRQDESYCPKLIFASSIAVFGAPLPAPIPDTFHLTPQTSYGTQKAICELLLSDYSRKGFVDGIALRLPTIVVRPGKPNKAASGFFSGIIREPLNGQEALLPVPDDTLHWMASPRAAVGFFLHAARLDTADMTGGRAVTLPGLAVTVAEEIDTLRKIGGDARVKLIKRVADPLVEQIVAAWPRQFDASRALSLGFTPDESFEAIVRSYIEDEGIAI